MYGVDRFFVVTDLSHFTHSLFVLFENSKSAFPPLNKHPPQKKTCSLLIKPIRSHQPLRASLFVCLCPLHCLSDTHTHTHRACINRKALYRCCFNVERQKEEEEPHHASVPLSQEVRKRKQAKRIAQWTTCTTSLFYGAFLFFFLLYV